MRQQQRHVTYYANANHQFQRFFFSYRFLYLFYSVPCSVHGCLCRSHISHTRKKTRLNSLICLFCAISSHRESRSCFLSWQMALRHILSYQRYIAHRIHIIIRYELKRRCWNFSWSKNIVRGVRTHYGLYGVSLVCRHKQPFCHVTFSFGTKYYCYSKSKKIEQTRPTYYFSPFSNVFLVYTYIVKPYIRARHRVDWPSHQRRRRRRFYFCSANLDSNFS